MTQETDKCTVNSTIKGNILKKLKTSTIVTKSYLFQGFIIFATICLSFISLFG